VDLGDANRWILDAKQNTSGLQHAGLDFSQPAVNLCASGSRVPTTAK
jgi:hypothetical protein